MAPMSGKERILCVLSGGIPDRVPFVPNIWQWFYANQTLGTLPTELREVREPVEALRVMGADVMSKFDGVVLIEKLDVCRHTVSMGLFCFNCLPRL